jgi:hypothetical protein
LFWRRFVDETFTIVKKDANIKNLIEILNSFDKEIVFTYEEEKKNSLPFFDINITRLPTNNLPINSSNSLPHSSSNNLPNNTFKSFSTTIYRKPTYTGSIMKWNSFVRHAYKVSTISSMVYRAIKICSTNYLMHEEFEFIENICIENGYPEGFIKAQIRKTLGKSYDKINGTNEYSSKRKTNTENLNSIKKEEVFIDIPFYGKPTEGFRKRFTNLAKSLNPNINIQPILRPLPSLSKYFPIKDPIPNEHQSNIVYKINCTECKASYIGKTERQAIRRFQEHGADLKIEKPTKNKPVTINKIIDNLRRSERNKGKT